MLDRLPRKGPRPRLPLVLYTRRDCPLCDEMKRAIAETPLGVECELTEVDIEGDAELERAHGLTIPVLEIAGEVAFEGRLEPRALRREVERRAAAWRRGAGAERG